ncbi:MAG: hypothetical protein GY846_22555 [Deltaproteobacteria bacterium]|nr:hypothetical protein [Deltaproteobacteria bacterium]
MNKVLRSIFVLSLLLFFANTAEAVTPSGSGSQEIRQSKTFIVNMWDNTVGPKTDTNYPSSNLIFGVAATRAPFARTSFLPAYTYSDATYGNGTVDELQITPDGGATYEGRVQAVVKYSLAGVSLANFQSATLTLTVTDFRKTGNITTDMAVGVYDMQAAQKTNGTVVITLGTIYPTGTLLDTINVSYTPGETFNVDVTSAVRSDLEAGRSFSGFILYAQNVREGLEDFGDSPQVARSRLLQINRFGLHRLAG